jgi:hypothetical protein
MFLIAMTGIAVRSVSMTAVTMRTVSVFIAMTGIAVELQVRVAVRSVSVSLIAMTFLAWKTKRLNAPIFNCFLYCVRTLSPR